MNIHLTGDSLMARYEGCTQPMINEKLKELDRELSITNTAHPGDNTADLLARIKIEILTGKKADKIFILIGTNDLAINKQLTIEQFKDNLVESIKLLCTVYKLNEIYFITPPPVDEQKQRYRTNQIVQEYTLVMKKVVKEEHCNVLDLYQEFINYSQLSVNELLHGMLDDGLHFGQVGYLILARTIAAVL